MAPTPVIIDTDPGQDDAVALLLALASPELAVLGVTTVAGNVPLPLTAANARRVCEAAGRDDVPVFAGCDAPLQRGLTTAEHVHGPSGLEGAGLPPPAAPLAHGHAVDFIVETAMSSRAKVTLCALGPLTNLATAFAREPRLAENVERVVAMGGSIAAGGNVTPVAEFNVHVDPHAADVVFRSGCPLVLVPLDVTHRVLTTPERLARIGALGNPVADTCHRILRRYDTGHRERYGEEGSPLHDPCVIAYLLDPSLFEAERLAIRIETGSELTLGMTVADRWRVTGDPPNCEALVRVDADRFYDLLIERLGRYGE